jgi:hypothetical protein
MSKSFARVVPSLVVAGFLLVLCSYGAAQELRVKPATKSVNLGEEFVIEIEVADIVDLYGHQFDIHYNPGVLEYLSYSYGPFLSRNGQDPTFPLSPKISPGLIHNCVNTRMGDVDGISGTGILVSVNFRVIAGGQSSILLDNMLLVDSSINTISCSVSPGIVYVIGQHPAVITTSAVSAITYQSAVSGGTIITDGGAEITGKGVCWSTHLDPTLDDSHTNDGTGNWSFVSQITGLTSNTVYHVRAYATNAADTSYGADIQFQTAVYDPPGAFNLLSPADGASLQKEVGPAWIYLTWEAAEGAEYYDVYFGTGPEPALYWGHIAGTSCEIETGSPGGPFYWRIMAVSAGGETWSTNGPWLFSIEAIELEPFDLLTPEDGARLEKTETVALTWEESVNADYYVLEFGESPDPTWYDSYVWPHSYTVPVIPGRTYYWDVVAIRDVFSLLSLPSSNGPRHFHVARTEDFVATWDGQGVYYRDSDSSAWVKMASPASQVTVGDLDCDGIDDIIGIWPGQGGVWVFLSSTKTWVRLGSTPADIAAGDVDGDGCDEFVGTWDGQGVFYLTEIGGSWVKLASPATLIAVGDLDGDHRDDLVGIWPTQGGVWARYSTNGAWSRLSSTAIDIAVGDMNGDGRDDLLATWDGQGVYYRDSTSGAWIKMASQADRVTCGDLDADGKDDLIGIWPTQGGVWAKYSKSGAWARLSSTARDIAAGAMRSQIAEGAVTEAQDAAPPSARLTQELPLPMGGIEEGPEIAMTKRDLSDRGPGGARFIYIEDLHLDPDEDPAAALTRIPGPNEPGFIAKDQKNLNPGECPDRGRDSQKVTRVKDKKTTK